MMTLTSLIALSRLYIPEANSTDVVSDANMTILLNLACTEFINKTEALPTSRLFDLVLDLLEYPLSTYVTDFGKIREEGLWWYNKVTEKWSQLDSTTIPALNEDYPSWLNTSSSNPFRYSIDGDILTLHPPTSSTYAGTNYLKIFYYAHSIDMTAGLVHYPFTGSLTKHYSHLAEYEETLIDYVRFKIKQMLKKNADAEEAKNTFYTKCTYIKNQLKERPDLISQMGTRGVSNLAQAKNVFK